MFISIYQGWRKQDKYIELPDLPVSVIMQDRTNPGDLFLRGDKNRAAEIKEKYRQVFSQGMVSPHMPGAIKPADMQTKSTIRNRPGIHRSRSAGKRAG